MQLSCMLVIKPLYLIYKNVCISFFLVYCSNLLDASAHQNLPESNPLRMDETRKRNALVMQALKDAAETDDNIASRMGRHR